VNRRFEPTIGERTLIESVISQHLNGHRTQPCNIFIEADEDGVESISVGLCYDLSNKPVDPEKSIDMLAALRDALIANGDNRVPYIEHYFDDSQPIRALSRAC
jgi:hypothetical protein